MPLMTPMVQEAIALLALPKLEVAAIVQRRLATNPWLVEQPELPFPSPVPIVCELIVTKGLSGYTVCLYDQGLPTIGVKVLTVEDRASKAAGRLHNEAVWLVKGLACRRKLLQMVAETVVQLQAEFLEQGRAGLKPLTLGRWPSRSSCTPRR